MDQSLERRMARLESDLAHMRSDIAEMRRRQKLEAADRTWRRDQTAFDLVMLLANAVTFGALAHGFKWL
ncbi:MAG TPA: hypothetical protein VGT07_01600 [Steroidobacteraceae bacterium]|nr:hypothetical protein [Steroidobacteraceae bacterium]